MVVVVIVAAAMAVEVEVVRMEAPEAVVAVLEFLDKVLPEPQALVPVLVGVVGREDLQVAHRLLAVVVVLTAVAGALEIPSTGSMLAVLQYVFYGPETPVVSHQLT